MYQVIPMSASVAFHCPEGYSIEGFIEKIARKCYKSEEKIGPETAEKLINRLNRSGHGAMLEHASATAELICDRGISHEAVRHRLASFAQESTRYCDYTKGKFQENISVIQPLEIASEKELRIWEDAMSAAGKAYRDLRNLGVPPQRARHVLPISLKTEIAITTNLREWMHIFNLRCAKSAHPHIRTTMLNILDIFADRVPVLFEEIRKKFHEIPREKIEVSGD